MDTPLAPDETPETPAPSPKAPKPKIGALFAALAAAQAEIGGATRTRTNPAFRSSYADLADCWDACRAPLAKNKLGVIQLVECDVEFHVVTVTTILGHASGEEISSALSMPVAKWDAHGIGSATTYARRYGLCAMVGIAPEDDDGNAAAGKLDKAGKAEALEERASNGASETETRDKCVRLISALQEARVATGKPRPSKADMIEEVMGAGFKAETAADWAALHDALAAAVAKQRGR